MEQEHIENTAETDFQTVETCSTSLQNMPGSTKISTPYKNVSIFYLKPDNEQKQMVNSQTFTEQEYEMLEEQTENHQEEILPEIDLVENAELVSTEEVISDYCVIDPDQPPTRRLELIEVDQPPGASGSTVEIIVMSENNS